MNKSKGFTIIELIVVIAIIAVLAAVVLVNVTSYISKGKDTAIKGNMSAIVTSAATFFDLNNTYVGLGANQSVVNALANIKDANPGKADAIFGAPTASEFCVEDTLNGGETWCVDATGYVGLATAGKCLTDINCVAPAAE